jgi:hypothetical protein
MKRYLAVARLQLRIRISILYEDASTNTKKKMILWEGLLFVITFSLH